MLRQCPQQTASLQNRRGKRPEIQEHIHQRDVFCYYNPAKQCWIFSHDRKIHSIYRPARLHGAHQKGTELKVEADFSVTVLSKT